MSDYGQSEIRIIIINDVNGPKSSLIPQHVSYKIPCSMCDFVLDVFLRVRVYFGIRLQKN